MALVIKNLKKNFGRKESLHNFSYSFADRGIYAVTGESGIGKTTLLRIIAGLDKDFTGELLGAEQVSVAFQEHRLFPNLNALDNIVFAISERKDEAVIVEAKKILSKLGFDEADMLLFPDQLSGGMKQRVSLARSFLYEGKILLLDEPTKELDEENAKRVKEVIKELSQSRLVILVSHKGEDLTDLGARIIDLENQI